MGITEKSTRRIGEFSEGGLSMNLRALGKRIKQAREQKHLTREQLAEAIGLKDIHITMLEEGEKPPKVSTLIKIANALEISADELLHGELTHPRKDPYPEFSDLLSKLTPEDRWRVYNALCTYVECTPTLL